MAHHRGPKTSTQDLIFYYDTGNEKSLVGEPTTNLATNLDLYDMGLGLTYLGVEDGWKKYSMSGTWSGGGYPYSVALGAVSFTGGLSYTTKATIKTNVEYKFNYFGTSGVNYVNEPKNSSGTSTAILNGDGSRTVSTYNFAYTNTTTQLGYLLTNPINGITFNPSTDFIWLKDYQVEQKSHATPFVNGTRSVTQGLLDLTRNETINLSSVSFDSNAQMSFDGTDDFIDTNFSPTSINNSTIEAVVYRNTATGRYEAIIQNNVDSDDALYVYPSGILGFWPCSPSSLTVPTGQWSYVAVSYNGSTLTYCVNGVIQVITTTCEHIMDWDFLRIGAHGSGDGERWIGKIAIAKLYNRSLTSSELYQNYNAIKTRFGI